MCAGLLIEKLDKVCLCTSTTVRFGLGASLREILDCWIRADALVLGCSFRVIGFRIDLSDEDTGLVCEVLRDCLPDGGKRLAI